MDVYDDCTLNIVQEFERQMQEKVLSQTTKYKQEIRLLEEKILELEKQQKELKPDSCVKSSKTHSEASTSTGRRLLDEYSAIFGKPGCSPEQKSASLASCSEIGDKYFWRIMYGADFLSDVSYPASKQELIEEKEKLHNIETESLKSFISLEEFREMQRLQKRRKCATIVCLSQEADSTVQDVEETCQISHDVVSPNRFEYSEEQNLFSMEHTSIGESNCDLRDKPSHSSNTPPVPQDLEMSNYYPEEPHGQPQIPGLTLIDQNHVDPYPYSVPEPLLPSSTLLDRLPPDVQLDSSSSICNQEFMEAQVINELPESSYSRPASSLSSASSFNADTYCCQEPDSRESPELSKELRKRVRSNSVSKSEYSVFLTLEPATKRLMLEENKADPLLEIRNIMYKIAKTREYMSKPSQVVKTEISEVCIEEPYNHSANVDRSDVVNPGLVANNVRPPIVNNVIESEGEWERKRLQDLKTALEIAKLEKDSKQSKEKMKNILEDYRQRKLFDESRTVYIASISESTTRRRVYSSSCLRHDSVERIVKKRSDSQIQMEKAAENCTISSNIDHHGILDTLGCLENSTENYHTTPDQATDAVTEGNYRNITYNELPHNVNAPCVASPGTPSSSNPPMLQSHLDPVVQNYIREGLGSIPLPPEAPLSEQFWFSQAKADAPLSELLAGPAPPPDINETDDTPSVPMDTEQVNGIKSELNPMPSNF